MQHTQNKVASGCQCEDMASRITYMGPPCSSPRESLPRYKLANVLVKKLVDIPIKEVTHIQNKAPGPPIAMAAATPARFPIPTVDAKAVDKALYALICPGASGSSYFPRRTLTAWKKYLY